MHRGTTYGRARRLNRGWSRRGDKKYPWYTLAVPNEIGDRVPKNARFVCSMTDYGIMFHLLDPRGIKEDVLPEWAKPPKGEKFHKAEDLIVIDLRPKEMEPDIVDANIEQVEEEPRWSLGDPYAEDDGVLFDWD